MALSYKICTNSNTNNSTSVNRYKSLYIRMLTDVSEIRITAEPCSILRYGNNFKSLKIESVFHNVYGFQIFKFSVSTVESIMPVFVLKRHMFRSVEYCNPEWTQMGQKY